MLEQHAVDANPRGWSLCCFPRGKPRGGEEGRDGIVAGCIFCRKWRHFSLIARSREKSATTEVNVQLPRAARIVCTGRAIEAHSSAIACTLFFITVLVPLARSGFNFKAISPLIYEPFQVIEVRFLHGVFKFVQN